MTSTTAPADRTPIETVEGYVGGLNGTVETYNPWPYVADEFVYDVRGTNPLTGIHVGLEKIDRELWRGVFEKFAEVRMVVDDAQELEDGRVIATLHSRNLNHDGSIYEAISWYEFTIAEGKVVRAVKCYIDTDAVNRAFPGASDAS